MVVKLEIKDFLDQCSDRVVVDVRTPAEFSQGHIPGAVNLPLFSNEERAIVGTIYKQQGPQKAMTEALTLAGPKLSEIVRAAYQNAPDARFGVHCWRGGKRSGSVAWLLDFTGADVVVLDSGYKSYRRYVLDHFDSLDLKLIVLGGRTGSRKTDILLSLKELGEQVIDLEDLADHKGSAFGWIGERSQTSSEQFENTLFSQLMTLDHSKPIWVENESRAIGKIRVPAGFWNRMKNAPLINIEIDDEDRVAHLVSLYAGAGKDNELIEAFSRIESKLGGLAYRDAVQAVSNGDYAAAARIALKYYDKTYDYNLSINKAPRIFRLKIDTGNPSAAARELIGFCQSNTIFDLAQKVNGI